ncbi:MAG: hypothetical protein IKU37_01635 [Candidatus Gastranaerophilales bacterium]|nr:hypothetical protein [Candidatus Gastranaerophilales bacterium]
MSYINNLNKNKKNGELDFFEIFNKTVLLLLGIGVIWFIKWAYFDVYKPEEKRYIKNSRYAYKIIQTELTKYYRKKGYVYNKDEDSAVDEFCEVLRNKYSPIYGNCNIEEKISNEPNIIFKNKGIHIYGFEKKHFPSDGTLVKDIIIDVNGTKGENTFGVDQVPIRIYSTGRMGGMLSPVNCKKEDTEDYGISYSPICPAGFDFNFMDSKIPFSYDVYQIGGKNGKSKRLGQNISFLRADCIAFGSEILGASEYCEKRGYHWLTACYHEYFCATQFHEKK